MKKPKMSELVDRFSTLPDSLIFQIFWLIPMSDFVKTSLLSKRWKDLWTTSPHLNFTFSSKYKVTDKVRNFVNRSLIAWRGKFKIRKFRVAFEFRIKKSLYSDINLWLRFAMENGVEGLYLDFLYVPDEGEGKASTDTELKICSPNLENLGITGVPYRRCLLVDISPLKLTHATLLMSGHLLFSGDDFIEDTLRQILPTIQYVESLLLADWSLKVLGDMKKKDMVPSFPNVKSLYLDVVFEEYEQIMGLLEMFPKLKSLYVEADEAYVPCSELLKLDINPPESFLLQLRTVDVTWTKGNNMFPFIEVLLKYASNLEKMVFRVKGKKTPAASPSKNLLRMKRSSPIAELILL